MITQKNLWRLAWTGFRRDLGLIGLWVGLTFMIMVESILKYVDLYSTNAQIQTLVKTMQSPGMAALFGKMPVLSHYNTSILLSVTLTVFIAVFTSVMNIQLAMRGTRAAEDSGLVELVRSSAVSKGTPLLATLIELAMSNFILWIVLFGTLQGAGLSGSTITGNLLFSAGTVLFGAFFGGIALVASQLFDNARSANVLTYAIFGFSFVLRMMVDVKGITPNWYSPFNWLEDMKIYYGNHLTGLLIIIVLTLVLFAVAAVINVRRDVGAGVFGVGYGRSRAGHSLRGFGTLFARLETSAVVTWVVAGVAMGAMMGSIFPDLQSLLTDENSLIVKALGVQKVLHMQAMVIKNFIAFILIMFLLMAVLAGMFVMQRQHKDARSGALDLIGAKPLSRTKLYFTYLIGGLATAVIVWTVTILALGATGNAVLSHPLANSVYVNTVIAYLPVIAVYIGLAGLVVGGWPSGMWLLFAYTGIGFMVNYFKGMFDLPDWLTKCTPIGWIHQVPINAIEWGPWLALLAISVVLIGAGWWLFDRRDLV